MSIFAFLKARIIRLYPLYILGTVIGILAIVGRSHFLLPEQRSLSVLGTAILLGTLIMPDLASRRLTDNAYPMNPPAWSLFFELLANLFYAILLRIRLASSLVIGCIATVSLATTAILVFRHNMSFNVGWAAMNFSPGVPRVGYSFFVGVLLFRAYKKYSSLRVPPRYAGWIGCFILVTMTLALAGQFSFGEQPLYKLFLTAVLFPGLVFLGACTPVSQRWKAACLFLGDFSYPLYILHLPLMSPLYLLQKLHMEHLPFYQALGPATIIVLVFVTRWIALHYDAPLRKYLSSPQA